MEAFNVVAVTVIIGVVRGFILTLEQFTKVNVNSILGFGLSLLVGIVLGSLGYFGLNIETGIISALVATGTYQLAKKVGSN